MGHIVANESLRKGLVPERGIEAFAVGVDKPRGEIGRQLEMAASGEGTVKFLRGGYGCGKTFMARLAVLDAQQHGFATSFVVVSDNDLHFHKFDDVYLLRVEQLYPFPTKALMTELSRFKQAEVVWCQEEPRNMGAWVFVDIFLEWVLNQIGANAPLSIKCAMEAINKGTEASLAEGLVLESTFVAICTSTEDKKEGTTAFLEKRAANFNGR